MGNIISGENEKKKKHDSISKNVVIINDKVKNEKQIKQSKDEFIFDYCLKSIPIPLKKLKNKKLELWCKKCFGKYDLETEKELLHFMENGWSYEYLWHEKNDLLEENFANIYTRGLKENYNHFDFQIVLPLDPSTTSFLVGLICDQVKNGFSFENEKYYSNIFQGYSIGFMKKIIKLKNNQSMQVLRIIFPFIPGLLYISNPNKYFEKQINFDSIYQV